MPGILAAGQRQPTLRDGEEVSSFKGIGGGIGYAPSLGGQTVAFESVERFGLAQDVLPHVCVGRASYPFIAPSATARIAMNRSRRCTDALVRLKLVACRALRFA